MPGDLDHPYWVEDGDFDLEYHVRHIALPKPGDWRQFCIQAARLHARPLDLSQAAVGAVRHRGPRQRRGRPEGRLRLRAEGPPRRDRRQVRRRDDHAPSTPRRPRWSTRRRRRRRGARARPVAVRAATAGPAINAVRDARPAAMRLAGRLVPGLGRAAGRCSADQRPRPPAAWRPAPGSTGRSRAHRVLDARRSSRSPTLKPMRNLVRRGDGQRRRPGRHRRRRCAPTSTTAGELPDASLRAMTPVSVRTEAEKARPRQPGLGDDRQPGDRRRRPRRAAGRRAPRRRRRPRR